MQDFDSQQAVAIVDYNLGNLFSVSRACEKAGLATVITSDPNVIARARGVILPGVGAFPDAMAALRQLDLVDVLKAYARSGRPLLGICLGMQLLFDESEEFTNSAGLGLIAGGVKRLPDSRTPDGRRLKVPHIGWNAIHPGQGGVSWQSLPMSEIKDGTNFFFVHSFYAIPDSRSVVMATSRFGDLEYCAAVRDRNVIGCQFHPERSGREGLLFYRNVAKMMMGEDK